MSNPSPSPGCAATVASVGTRRGSSLHPVLLLAAAGLVGIAVAAFLIWPRGEPRADGNDPLTVPSPTGAAPATARTSDPVPPSAADLEARVRAAVAALAASIQVSGRLLDEGDRPLAAAAVDVAGLPIEPPIATDAAGRFSFAVPRTWSELDQVVLRADGQAPLRLSGIVLPCADLDLGDLHTTGGARAHGRLRTIDGAPVGGAVVTARAVTAASVPTAPRFLEEARTTTAADGSFTVGHLGVRVVEIVAQTPGLALALAENVALGGPRVSLIAELPRTIAGVVRQADGQPVAGATVEARFTGPRALSGQTTVIGPDGIFRLDQLAPGYYVMTVDHEEFERTVVRSVHTDVTQLAIMLTPLAGARLEIVGAPAGLDIPVTWRTVERVGGAGGGASRAELRPTSGRRLAVLRDGQLVVRRLPAGSHALEVGVPGVAPIVTAAFTAVSGETTELGSYALEPGAVARGRVVAPTGRPLVARIALAAPHLTDLAAGRSTFELPDRDERVTGADGRFEWHSLPAGRRRFAFTTVGSAGDFTEAGRVVELAAGSDIDLGDIVLQPAGSAGGEVRERTGRPLAGMLVEIEGAGTTLHTETDALGRYAFRGLAPARYRITVILADAGPPPDLGSALAPRENPTAGVEVHAGETARRDFQIAQ